MCPIAPSTTLALSACGVYAVGPAQNAQMAEGAAKDPWSKTPRTIITIAIATPATSPFRIPRTARARAARSRTITGRVGVSVAVAMRCSLLLVCSDDRSEARGCSAL